MKDHFICSGSRACCSTTLFHSPNFMRSRNTMRHPSGLLQIFVIFSVSLSSLAAGQRAPQNCRISWVLTLNSYTVGGVQDASTTTIDQCLSRCLADLSCRGIQVRRLSNAVDCWRFYEDNFALTSSIVFGYDQYAIQSRCYNGTVCSVKWQYWENTKFQVTGSQYPGITNVPSCLATCIQTPGCIGVDVKKTAFPPQCFVHFNSSTVGNVLFTQEYDQYLLLDACAVSINFTSTTALSDSSITRVPSYCWNETARTQYYGLDQTSYNTVDECKTHCINHPRCLVINFDITTNPACWVQTDGKPLTPDDVYVNSNVTTYYLNRNCAASSTTSSVTTTSMSATATKFTGCWKIHQQRRYYFLNQAPFSTVQSCQNYCQRNLPDCTIINFDPSTSPPCWVKDFSGPLEESNFEVHPSITTYELDKDCAVTSSSSARTTSRSSFSQRTTSPTDVCWTIRPRFQYYGLSPVSFNTERACKDYCISLSQCTMIDFDYVGDGTSCWVQTTALVISESDYYENNNVNNFRLNRTCIQTIINQTQTTTAAPANCVRWKELPSNISLNGVFQPHKTLQSCQAGCVAEPNCVAIDFDSSFVQCYNHYNPADLEVLYEVPTASQFRLERKVDCGTTSGPSGCFRWTLIDGKNSVNGVEKPSYPSPTSCQQGCIADSQCVAIDYDTYATPPCWFHYSRSNLEDLYDNPNSKQYRLTRNPLCESSCFTWVESRNKISLNGVLQSASHSLESCKEACTKDPTCIAIDYQISGLENCWFHSNANDIKDHYDSEIASQYRLIRDPKCLNDTSSTTVPTSSTTTRGTNSSSCVQGTFNNTSSVGGLLIPNINSAVECRNHCLRTLQCVGVDYDPQSGCYVHNDINAFDSNRKPNQSPGVIQFVISRNCTPVTATRASTQTSTMSRPFGPSSCVLQVYNVTNSPGGSSVMGLATSQDCVDFCLQSPTCVGVDFDSQTGCWQHNNKTTFDSGRKIGQSPNVVQFVISHECLSSISTATSTTTSSPVVPSCAGSFQVFFNTSSVGASNQKLVTTPLACLMYCLENPNACTALDFDTTTGCWIHLDRLQVLTFRRYPSPGVVQFVMERSCSDLPVCSFQVLKNTYSANGLFLTEVRGLTACLYYCLITPTCIAVDYSVSGSCVAHGNIYYVESNRRETSGMTQFLLTRVNCLVVPPPQTLNPFQTSSTTTYSTSSSSSTFSSTTTGTTTSYIPPACPPTWTKYSNTFSFGGILKSEYIDFNSCLDGCSRDMSCYAVDVDILSTFKCQFHQNPNFASDTYYGLTTQYRIYRPCIGKDAIPGQCQNWTVKYDTNSINGIHYYQFTTMVSCQLLCVNLPFCVAVDFNTQFNSDAYGCWVHSTLQDLQPENTFPTQGVNQFILNRACEGSCFYAWTQYLSNSMTNGIPQRDTTLAGCQARCISIPECTGIDVDKRPGYIYCYLHLSTNLYLFPNSYVDHYQLTRSPDCVETKTTTTPSTSTTTSSSIQHGCSVKKLTSSNADGGQKLPNPMSNLECASLCVSLYPQCVAADWRQSDSACFIHTSLAGRRFSSCCDRYEITCNDTQATTGCYDDFVANKFLTPAPQTLLVQPSTYNLEQCQVACINYGQSCLAVVYSTAGRIVPGQSTCYLVTSPSSLNTASPSSDFDLYVRRFCQRDLTQGLTTTPYPTPIPGSCLLDIVFLVDTSGSILDNQPPGVNSMLLIRSFISSFLTSDVGFYLDHVGIVIFDTTARVVYDLCDMQTIESINSTGVSKVVQSLGTTNTPSGFDAVYEVLFNPSRCARSTAKPVVIFISDGYTSPEFQSFYRESLSRLTNSRAIRIAIGVTTDINNNELQQFASPTLSTGVYRLDSYSQLIYYRSSVYNQLLSQCGRPARP